MVLDLCIESVTAVVHLLDSAFVGSGLLTHRAHQTVSPVVHQTVAPPNDLDAQVRLATAALSFRQAQALWLVDVCGESYAQAAVACRTTEAAINNHVRTGRTSIRNQIAQPLI